ncbi:helix-turn-helix domain-containing protein [Streptomyces sp. DT24]|uniref:helix-turn-helix domain-containing protein n=1 Tax=Streptomyces sp. DT24 TaxID=3416520 RepID=UPI003CF841AE
MSTEIQDFAELLRGLKERSGLSYGALAGKLHMSTSTVHRYCNGDAIPHDYAPVERFARLCRASADELVELHRKWILADEAKRRRATTGAADAAGGAGGADADGASRPAAAGPAASTGAPAPAPTSASVPTSAPVPAPAEGAVSDGGSGGGPSSGNASSGTPSTGNPSSGTSSSGIPSAGNPSSGNPVSTASAPERRRLRRPTRIALAAAAVVALAVPTTLLVGRMSGSWGDDTVAAGHAGEPAGPQHTDASRSASAPTPSGSSADRSGSPSPFGTTSSPSKGATAGTGKRGGTADTTGGGSGSQGSTGTGVPLAVNIRPDIWEGQCGQIYLLDRKPDKVPPPPYEQDARNWARALGAVPGGTKRVDLVAQGKEQVPVVLQAMHVRVVGRSPTPAWPAYSMREGCGGGVAVSTYEINLDAPRPLFRAVATERAGEPDLPAAPLPLKTSVDDPVVLEVVAMSRVYDVRWYLELEWVSGDRHGTMRIDDNGKPFRTTGIQDRPLYDYWDEKGEWEVRTY